MLIYAISPEQFSDAEIPLVEALVAGGLEAYHLRKPGVSREETASCLRQLPAAVRRRVVLHEHHALVAEVGGGGCHYKDTGRIPAEIPVAIDTPKPFTQSRSIHHLRELVTTNDGWDYLFLSPVFPSLSKAGYGPGWTRAELCTALEQTRKKKSDRICALGGVNRERAVEAKELGFEAVVLCGALWQSSDPVRVFQEIKEVLQ